MIITSGGIKGYSLAEYVIAENVSISRAATTQVYNSDLSSSIIEYAKQFFFVFHMFMEAQLQKDLIVQDLHNMCLITLILKFPGRQKEYCQCAQRSAEAI